MCYLNYLIPVIGRLSLGNPGNYPMLGVYTEVFGDMEHFSAGVRGRKPAK